MNHPIRAAAPGSRTADTKRRVHSILGGMGKLVCPCFRNHHGQAAACPCHPPQTPRFLECTPKWRKQTCAPGIENPSFNVRRSSRVFLHVLAVLTAAPLGCAIPSPSAPVRVTSLAARDARRESVPVRYDMMGTSPVNRLTVNGETLEAHKVWRDLRDDLTTRAKVLTAADYRAFVEQRAAQWITDRIAEMLLYQQASLRFPPEMNSRIDAHLDGEIRRIVTTAHDGIQRRYEKHLEAQGQTLDDVRTRLRREMIVTSYLEQEVKPKVAEPTRAELLATFEANADAFTRPPRRRMSLIDVRVLDRLPKNSDTPSRDQVQRARSEALARMEAVQAQLRDGRAFADVARDYSDGLHAVDGGAWGWVTGGSVRERFEPAVEALYRLKAGEISDIVETRGGFFLVLCDEIDPGLEAGFQAVQPQLTEYFLRTAYNRKIVELVAELRSKARIEPPNLDRFHAAVVEAALRGKPTTDPENTD